MNEPRIFYLQRHTDRSGISGTGLVAWGVVFPDDTTVVRWVKSAGRADPTTVVHQNLANVEALHGHGGDTEIVFLGLPPPKVEDDDDEVLVGELVDDEPQGEPEPKDRKEELERMMFRGFQEGRPR